MGFFSYGLFGFLWQKIVLQKSQSIWNNWTTSEMSSDTTPKTITFNKTIPFSPYLSPLTFSIFFSLSMDFFIKKSIFYPFFRKAVSKSIYDLEMHRFM